MFCCRLATTFFCVFNGAAVELVVAMACLCSMSDYSILAKKAPRRVDMGLSLAPQTAVWPVSTKEMREKTCSSFTNPVFDFLDTRLIFSDLFVLTFLLSWNLIPVHGAYVRVSVHVLQTWVRFCGVSLATMTVKSMRSLSLSLSLCLT